MIQLKDEDLVQILKLRMLDLDHKLYNVKQSSGTYNKQDPTAFEKCSAEFCIETEFNINEKNYVDKPLSQNVFVKWEDVTWGENIKIKLVENIEEDWQLEQCFKEIQKEFPQDYPGKDYQEYLAIQTKKVKESIVTLENYIYRECFIRLKDRTEKHGEFHWDKSDLMRKLILFLLIQKWYPVNYSWASGPMGELIDYE